MDTVKFVDDETEETTDDLRFSRVSSVEAFSEDVDVLDWVAYPGAWQKHSKSVSGSACTHFLSQHLQGHFGKSVLLCRARDRDGDSSGFLW